jgi:ribose transport system ATP-binding protein
VTTGPSLAAGDRAAQAVAGVHDVDKRFAGVHAVKRVTLELSPGEIHCLIGENGAGKSTVVKLLAGVYRPDGGEVRIGGEAIGLRSPHDALNRGVSTVYQELTLVPYMTVAENIALGQEPVVVRGILDRRRRNRRAAELLDDLGIDGIPPQRAVGELGIAQQQLVEIAKAVSREDERVLVLDEPTATLTSTETETLFALIRRLRQRGMAILYITHRLEELDEIGDLVTVMRDGAVVHRGRVRDTSRGALIQAMVGREITEQFERHRSKPGDVALEIRERMPGPDGKARAIAVRRGEVVALFGLIGAGRTEMVRGILGADPPGHHEVRLGGRARRLRTPAQALAAGVALVPEDRKTQGVVPLMTVAANIGISSLGSLSRGPVLPTRSMPRLAEGYVKSLNIRASSVHQEIVNLSGGNQQKCLIARVLAAEAAVLILDEPTRGIDVGARVEVYRLISRLCEEGRAILMITSDLSEALAVSDRIYVMREGWITGELRAEHVTQDAVMRLAVGESSELDGGREADTHRKTTTNTHSETREEGGPADADS